MSMTFTKLFSSITESTIWVEPDRVRLVWICMLAMADRRGRVWASIPGLANRARVPVEDCQDAINRFLGPDPYSRTPDNDGRRIEPIDGGWKLLNYEKYRAIRDEETIKEAKRRYINSRRAVEKDVENVEQCRPRVDRSRPLYIQAEAEAEAEIKDNTPPAGVVKGEKAPRQRNPLFDALAEIEGANPSALTPTAAKTIGTALAEIRKATPDVTPDEIRRRANVYRTNMPEGATITASALKKHWARCEQFISKGVPQTREIDYKFA